MTGQEILSRLKPFIPAFRSALPPDNDVLAWVCGIFDRESLVGGALKLRVPGTLVGWGDQDRTGKYHGFGGCQKDTGGGGELVIRGFVSGIDLWTSEGQAKWIYQHVTSSIRILSAAFPSLAQDKLMEAALCAYNADIGLVLGTLEARHDPNSVTTKGDYGSDVMNRALLIAPLLPGA